MNKSNRNWSKMLLFQMIGLLFFVNMAKAQNYAINFDGIPSQSIDINPMIPFNNSFTIMGWVDIKESDGRIFSWGSPNINNYFSIELNAGKISCYVPTTKGLLISSNTVVLNAGWQHFVVTKSGNTLSIYINGILENTASFSKHISPTNSSIGGGLFNNSIQSKGAGTYDQLSFWNVALEEHQIRSYLTSDPLGTEHGLMACYDFNNPAVIPGGNNRGLTSLTDVSGNGHMGSLSLFPLNGETGNWVDGKSHYAPPKISSIVVNEISHIAAVLSGEIVNDESDPIIARGVCWNTSGNPTTAENVTIDGIGGGTFISEIHELHHSTTYYVRAYATNSSGTTYGDEYRFTTLNKPIPLLDIGILLFIGLFVWLVLSKREFLKNLLRLGDTAMTKDFL